MILQVFMSILFLIWDLKLKGSEHKQKSETWHNIIEEPKF